ncbi:MAG: FKBP-type peptidyl-prolyl cis-trans isomerase, partial [Bacteroidota bacterium]
AIPYTKNEEAKEGGFEEAIGMLQKGDDIKFRLTAATLFGEYVDLIATQHGIEKDTKMILSLHLRDVMTEEAYKQWETKQIAMLQKQQQEKAEQQHQEDAKTIADYLKKNEIVAQTTASGLHYVIDTPGQGASPQSGAQVKVNYTGRLLDGKVFDTSLEAMAKEHQVHNPQRTYAPLEFKVGMGQVIQGWDEGILLLNKGAKARFFIPSTLAYGSRAMGDVIPANAILTFEVELVDF